MFFPYLHSHVMSLSGAKSQKSTESISLPFHRRIIILLPLMHTPQKKVRLNMKINYLIIRAENKIK